MKKIFTVNIPAMKAEKGFTYQPLKVHKRDKDTKNAPHQVFKNPGCFLKELAPTTRTWKNFDQEHFWGPCHFCALLMADQSII